jgi:hypothetical protein
MLESTPVEPDAFSYRVLTTSVSELLDLDGQAERAWQHAYVAALIRARSTDMLLLQLRWRRN